MIKPARTKIGKILNYIRYYKVSRLLLSFMNNGYLQDIGWFNTLDKNCVDANNQAIPWAPYPYISFLKDHLNPDMMVFEYGSGSSTQFFSDRVKKVFSVEHDLAWHKKIKEKSLNNVELIFKELNNGYVNCIEEIGEKFDVIVVDGRQRVACIKRSVDFLKPKGILVLDDSDRTYYQEATDYLHSLNFKKISFWGIVPWGFINRNTTVFFKEL